MTIPEKPLAPLREIVEAIASTIESVRSALDLIHENRLIQQQFHFQHLYFRVHESALEMLLVHNGAGDSIAAFLRHTVLAPSE